jgi:hypothetical protein
MAIGIEEVILDPCERKWHVDGENYILRVLIIHTLCQMLTVIKGEGLVIRMG